MASREPNRPSAPPLAPPLALRHNSRSANDNSNSRPFGRLHPRRLPVASKVPLPPKVVVVVGRRGFDALCAYLGWWCPHLTRHQSLDTSRGPVQTSQTGLVGETRAFHMAYQGSAGNGHGMDLFSETNLPLDSAPRYMVGSKGQLACSATRKHYIKTGSAQELPPRTSDGLWSTFLPVPKAITI